MMIIRRLQLTAFAIISILISTAKADAQDGALPHQSLLWRITSVDGAVSHVFGTIHIADTTVFNQRDTVLRVLDASSSYASELNLDSMMSQLSPAALVLPRGTLYDLFDSTDVEKICLRLKQINAMLGSACTRLKPGAIMMVVAMSAIERTAPSSIDEFLWSRARKRGLQRRGLETVAEQLSVVDSMPPAYVLEQLKDLDSLEQQAEIMRKMYATEDLAGLYRFSKEDSGMDDATMSLLNDRRNVRMVERMEVMLNKGGAFIAIGALHLTGPSSVLDLLRRRNYRVEAVTGGARASWLRKGQTE